MWPKIWKIVVALFAFLGALIFLLISTLAILAFIQSNAERPDGQPEPVENLQYLVSGCGLQNLKIATIDKRHETSNDVNQHGDNINPGTGRVSRAYAMKLIAQDARELSISFPAAGTSWHQLRQVPLPYLHQSALNVYFANINKSNTTEWLPNETQLTSLDYLLKVTNISFDNDKMSSANICIFRPVDNRLYVVNLDNW
jgi:hypothetical protein